MRALIAHRRLVTDSTGQQMYELAIGARSFACFNGFNEPTAFTKKNDPEVIHMVTTVQGRFSNRSADWLYNAGQRSEFARGKTLGEWECVGIGWIYNSATATPNGPMHGRTMPPDANCYDWNIGNALRREGFIARYYDGWNGGYVATRRRLTPMEMYLSAVLSPFESEDRQHVPNNVQQASAIAHAIQHNQSAAGCLYSFVGAERPSGQAVAYLQTFRNVSEQQFQGWSGASAIKRSIIIQAWNQLDRRGADSNQSIYPLMDHLVNYGTDNAITCYAGHGVMLHAMKYGFWSLAEFFHNTTPMTVEGRYNKGAQSNNLKDRYRQACNQRGVAIPPEAESLFLTIKNAAAQSAPAVGPMVTHDRIGAAVAGGTLDRFIEGVTTAIRNIARQDPGNQIRRMMELITAHGDARRPPEPVAPPAPRPAPQAPTAPTTPAVAPQGAAQSATPRNTTAGAAVGFTQWTSAAVH